MPALVRIRVNSLAVEEMVRLLVSVMSLTSASVVGGPVFSTMVEKAYYRSPLRSARNVAAGLEGLYESRDRRDSRAK